MRTKWGKEGDCDKSEQFGQSLPPPVPAPKSFFRPSPHLNPLLQECFLPILLSHLTWLAERRTVPKDRLG